MEIINLPDIKFRIMVVKMFNSIIKSIVTIKNDMAV